MKIEHGAPINKQLEEVLWTGTEFDLYSSSQAKTVINIQSIQNHYTVYIKNTRTYPSITLIYSLTKPMQQNLVLQPSEFYCKVCH